MLFRSAAAATSPVGATFINCAMRGALNLVEMNAVPGSLSQQPWARTNLLACRGQCQDQVQQGLSALGYGPVDVMLFLGREPHGAQLCANAAVVEATASHVRDEVRRGPLTPPAARPAACSISVHRLGATLDIQTPFQYYPSALVCTLSYISWWPFRKPVLCERGRYPALHQLEPERLRTGYSGYVVIARWLRFTPLAIACVSDV